MFKHSKRNYRVIDPWNKLLATVISATSANNYKNLQCTENII